MRVSCPACGADMTLDALLTHDEARRALAQAMQLAPGLGTRLMKYLGLFRPGQRQLTMDRVAALLGELLPMIEAGQADRRGRLWSASREAWCAALDVVIEHRDAGRLVLPLKSHGYLLEVLAGLVEKAEAAAEREHHARLARGERPAREVGRVVTTGLAPALASIGLPKLPERGAPMPEQVRADLERMGLLKKRGGEADAGTAAESAGERGRLPLEATPEPDASEPRPPPRSNPPAGGATP